MKTRNKLLVVMVGLSIMISAAYQKATSNLQERKESGEIPGWLYVVGFTVLAAAAAAAILLPWIMSMANKATTTTP